MTKIWAWLKGDSAMSLAAWGLACLAVEGSAVVAIAWGGGSFAARVLGL